MANFQEALLRFQWLEADAVRRVRKPRRNKKVFTKEQYNGLYEFFREYEGQTIKSHMYTKMLNNGEDICIFGIHVENYNGCLSLIKNVEHKPNLYKSANKVI